MIHYPMEIDKKAGIKVIACTNEEAWINADYVFTNATHTFKCHSFY